VTGFAAIDVSSVITSLLFTITSEHHGLLTMQILIQKLLENVDIPK
jgi:hypothetical protein